MARLLPWRTSRPEGVRASTSSLPRISQRSPWPQEQENTTISEFFTIMVWSCPIFVTRWSQMTRTPRTQAQPPNRYVAAYRCTQVALTLGSNWRFRNGGGRSAFMPSCHQVRGGNTKQGCIAVENRHQAVGGSVSWTDATAHPGVISRGLRNTSLSSFTGLDVLFSRVAS